jgi:hypothetical protein
MNAERMEMVDKYFDDNAFGEDGYILVSRNDINALIDSILQAGGEKPAKHEKKFENFKDYICEKEKEGKIVIATFDGFAEVDLDEIIKQPIDGLLYDLNRDRATILTFIEDKKWVNDFACMKVITELKTRLSSPTEEEKGKLPEEARGLAILALQSARYSTDQEFQQQVDAVLTLTAPKKVSPEAER